MKQCMKCGRFLSSRLQNCRYCAHPDVKELEFEFSSYNPNYKIYTPEIIIDDRPYAVIESIGRGGFGRVIKILDTTGNKYFALKVPLIFDEIFSNQKGKSVREMKKSGEYLEKEINTLMNTPDEAFIHRYKKGTVFTHAKGREIRFPVLLMELANCTLEEILRYISKGGDNRIPYREKIKMIKESVNAISRLHSSGILHRDLSPDNLFAVDREDKIRYVLGDFGAAKSLLEREIANQSSEIVGHNAYLDSSRYNRKYSRDYRLDIYSLGIIITEILMGKFWTDVMGKENIHDFLAVDFEKEFLLRCGARYIPQNVIEVLQKAVKRDIEERYNTIADFRQALFAVLDSCPGEIKTGILTPAVITFPFYFTLSLPFKPTDKTFSQEIIRYEEGKKIELSDYRGAKIIFENCYPRTVRVKNTSFYSAVVSGNAVLLNFLNSKYMEIEKQIEKIDQDMEGKLHFSGMIEIERVT